MDDAAKPKLRWYRLTPDRFVLGLLAVELLLRLSDWQGWFPFYGSQGWGVLTTIAVVACALPLLPTWFVASLIFRWRFQYGIRSLLLLAVVVAIPCSWLATEVQQARLQRDSANYVWANGGMISYQVGTTSSWGRPWLSHPDWLTARFGVDFFVPVVEASAVNDVGSQYLSGLSGIHRLWLNSPAVTDTALMNIEGLSRLESLNLHTAAVTDAGLPRLRALGRLQNLSMGQTAITDAGLEEIGRMHRLSNLDLSETKISDSGLIHLEGLERLTVLDLSRTSFTDAGLPHLQRLPCLRDLQVNDTQLTDAGLDRIAQFPQLLSLGICRTKVTDAGLARCCSTHMQMPGTPIASCPFTGISAEGGSGPAFTPGGSRATKCSLSAPFTGLPLELLAASPAIEEARERA
jgi:hypothetical protein